MNIRVGDDVMVHIPIEDQETYKCLMPYQGVVMPVTKRVAGYRRTKFYYELEGAVSDAGVPYSFLPEWLISMKDEDDG